MCVPHQNKAINSVAFLCRARACMIAATNTNCRRSVDWQKARKSGKPATRLVDRKGAFHQSFGVFGFIKLCITAQSGPVILVILCPWKGGVCVLIKLCVCVCTY